MANFLRAVINGCDIDTITIAGDEYRPVAGRITLHTDTTWFDKMQEWSAAELIHQASCIDSDRLVKQTFQAKPGNLMVASSPGR